MPHQPASRREHAREFCDDAAVVSRVGEKPERCEKIEHYFEPVLPSGREPPHVTVGVAKVGAGPAIARDLQEILGVIDRVDVVSRFREQVRVSALTTRNVENPRANRQSQQVNESRDFGACAFRCKQRAVLQQVVGVERGLPPLDSLLQKKTGSRYAPKTDSIAARIS